MDILDSINDQLRPHMRCSDEGATSLTLKGVAILCAIDVDELRKRIAPKSYLSKILHIAGYDSSVFLTNDDIPSEAVVFILMYFSRDFDNARAERASQLLEIFGVIGEKAVEKEPKWINN